MKYILLNDENLEEIYSDKDIEFLINDLSKFHKDYFITQEKHDVNYLYHVKNKNIKKYFPNQGLVKLVNYDMVLCYELLTYLENNLVSNYDINYLKKLNEFSNQFVSNKNDNKTINSKIFERYKYYLSIQEFYQAKIISSDIDNRKLGDICEIIKNYKYIKETDLSEYLEVNRVEIVNTLKDFLNDKINNVLLKHGLTNLSKYESFIQLKETIFQKFYKNKEEFQKNINEVIKSTLYAEFEDWYVCVPKTHHQSKILGKFSNWCTSADSENSENIFLEYKKTSDLVVFINKKNISDKYKFHKGKEEFADRLNNILNHDDILDIFGKEFIFDYNLFINKNELKTPKIFEDIIKSNYGNLIKYIFKKFKHKLINGVF